MSGDGPPRVSGLDIAPLTGRHVRDWTALLCEGFGLPDARAVHFRTAVGDGDIRIARRDGRVAGTAAMLPMAQWFGGRPVPVAGLAAVVVEPRQRRCGVATALLRATLEEARRRGLAMAVLHAATLPLYARLGFARGGVCTDYRLTAARTLAPLAGAAGAEPLRVSRPTTVGREVLDTLRRRQARVTAGMVERPPLLWANLLEPSEAEPPDIVLIHGADGAADGYLLVRPPHEGGGELRLADACLVTGNAALQALRFLAATAGRGMIVAWPGGPDDALAHLAPETEVDIDDWDTWLVRVLDVPAALTARGWPRGLAAALDLEVDDPLLPANRGRWRLTVAGGRGSVVPAPDAGGPAALSVGVAALGPLFTGHLGARALCAMGLAHGPDETVALAATLFAGPAPWLSDRF